MKRVVSTPGKDLDALEGGHRALLERTQAAIRKAMPDFDEGLRYGVLEDREPRSGEALGRALHVAGCSEDYRSRFPGSGTGVPRPAQKKSAIDRPEGRLHR